MQRIMIFIDGNNFESAVSTLYGTHTKLDYEKLAYFLAQEKFNGMMQRLYYYTAIGDPKRDPDKVKNTQNFIDTLNKKVNRCIAKAGHLKYLGVDSNNKDIYSEKGTDVNIAIDMLSLAYNNAYDAAIIISADTDYVPVIKMIRGIGKNVILCVVDGQKAGVLKEICDESIYLKKEDLDKIKR